MFKKRSYQKELIDADVIPEQDLRRNLFELHRVNQLLGGYKISLQAIKKLQSKPKTIVDIGCGGGDLLAVFSKHLDSSIQLIGLDIKDVCISYSKERNDDSVKIIKGDYRQVFSEVPDLDVVHACLFMHHLKEDEIEAFVSDCLRNKVTLVVNDLERNPLAYWSIKIITSIFSKSRLVKNDAPLSVRRGFKKKEWHTMLQNAGATNYSVKNKWAFRHCVIVYG
ncbi:methyltransferase domain-containing protein [bacterium]|nr:methyltransferase domain-containing protein [bacterium]